MTTLSVLASVTGTDCEASLEVLPTDSLLHWHLAYALQVSVEEVC